MMTHKDTKSLDRVFLAIPIEASAQPVIAAFQSRLAESLGKLRWVRPDTLHLTLQFFGRTTEENLEKIKASMLSVGLRSKPFNVTISGLGVFPNLRRPRVLWMGFQPEEPLKELHALWTQALLQAGLAIENKSFSPHLTIGRFRQGESGSERRLTELAKSVPVVALTVNKLVLYESHLKAQGAEHIPIHQVKLGD